MGQKTSVNTLLRHKSREREDFLLSMAIEPNEAFVNYSKCGSHRVVSVALWLP